MEGERLKKLIQKKAGDLKKFSKLIGVDRTTLYNSFLQENVTSMRTLSKVAGGLGMDVTELVKYLQGAKQGAVRESEPEYKTNNMLLRDKKIEELTLKLKAAEEQINLLQKIVDLLESGNAVRKVKSKRA